MAQTKDEIKVAANGGIFVAQFSAEPTLPTDVSTPLDAAFTEVGYLDADGATITKTEEVEDINVWQSQDPVRRIVTARNISVAGSLAQWNRDTVSAAFGGGTWSEPTEGLFRFEPPADADELAEWVLVLEAIDGERKDRYVVERSNITGDIETQAVRNAAQVLPVTFQSLTPDGKDKAWYYLSNDPAYEAGS